MAERWWPVCIDCGDTSDSKRIETDDGFMCAGCHEGMRIETEIFDTDIDRERR